LLSVACRGGRQQAPVTC